VLLIYSFQFRSALKCCSCMLPMGSGFPSFSVSLSAIKGTFFFLWPCTLICGLDLWTWPRYDQDEPFCQMCRSKVILFDHYPANTLAHTHHGQTAVPGLLHSGRCQTYYCCCLWMSKLVTHTADPVAGTYFWWHFCWMSDTVLVKWWCGWWRVCRYLLSLQLRADILYGK